MTEFEILDDLSVAFLGYKDGHGDQRKPQLEKRASAFAYSDIGSFLID